jgi:Ca2+-binding EF-hand superfamily protein
MPQQGKKTTRSEKIGSSLFSSSKRMAFPVSAYERNMIVQALSTDELKSEFRKLDSEQGGNIDLQSLNNIFERDLEAVEKFLESIMNSVDLDNGGTLNFAEFLVLMVKVRHFFLFPF